MQYDFKEIEQRWQAKWREDHNYKVSNASGKPKCYVLDMFPYPSGQGLHVGHPLGYIASDIYSRYKRLQGFNVLHPMGYDAFGLPAEQYAIETGRHPASTTEENIKRYREQLDLMGFSYDWDREVRTSDPKFYRWTQWIFIKLFGSWYNKKSDKAEAVETLVVEFEKNGNKGVEAACDHTEVFTAEEWKGNSEKEQQLILLNYRLAFLSEAMVNWCPALGTVLANDEVKEGVSERGGHPVERKLMKQWMLRITAYADRLLEGLDEIDWSDSLTEMQRNWIGRSEGASLFFDLAVHEEKIEVFTTRPDTIFGATFMVLAPEHELVEQITTKDFKREIDDYVEAATNRSERDRMADTKTVTGVFTGAYALNPFTEEKIPIWIADYVLAGYGTGAIMAVPSGDQRDWDFATKFQLPIIPVIEGQKVEESADEAKDGKMINSGFMDGMQVPEATKAAIAEIEKREIGKAQINYKLRDAVFGRQRYWGEPIPIYYKDDVPYPMEDSQLPLELPEVDKYLPTEDGEPPLARAENWQTEDGYPIETTTMPGWAGSSWYYLRYMDADNEEEFVSRKAVDYWQNVDLYLGGAEHATGHLLYVRFWTKFLHDLGYLPFDEPAKKLINQGMIQAEDGQKMSKRYNNVVNPDDIISMYGADTLRLHEMFLGPLEQHKPWNTKGIEGVHRFLRKLWRLYHNKENNVNVSDEKPTPEELKVLHSAIKKVHHDTEDFGFNTGVSTLMIAVNELTELNCNKRVVLEALAIITAPYAPHIAEELWHRLGNDSTVCDATWPVFDESHLVEDNFSYPVQFNGKVRFTIDLPLEMSPADVEKEVLAAEQAQKYLEGKDPKKVIVVPKRIVNVVV